MLARAALSSGLAKSARHSAIHAGRPQSPGESLSTPMHSDSCVCYTTCATCGKTNCCISIIVLGLVRCARHLRFYVSVAPSEELQASDVRAGSVCVDQGEEKKPSALSWGWGKRKHTKVRHTSYSIRVPNYKYFHEKVTRRFPPSLALGQQ